MMVSGWPGLVNSWVDWVTGLPEPVLASSPRNTALMRCAFADAGLAGDQDVHAAGAARCGADGVRDGVLQGGVIGTECAHLLAVECNGGCGNDIRTLRIPTGGRRASRVFQR